MSCLKIGIIGLGFVGSSIYQSLNLKQARVYGYDKFKSSDSFESTLESSILFLCLPTTYNENLKQYDKSSLNEVCHQLSNKHFTGIIIIKSTVEPLTTQKLSDDFPNLNFIHNPEFLTAKTAFEDFHNQKHVVLGRTHRITDQQIDLIKNFYSSFYPQAEISECTSTESESMKIFVNNFYSIKVQFFTELFSLCQKIDCDYDVIKNLMLKNGWINPMHTQIPGPDGQISYGGYCFPKDTNALLQFMKQHNSPHQLLESCINERNLMRDDNVNIDN
jgi:UDPglucose 6-dehydrogenase